MKDCQCSSQSILEQTRRSEHPDCIICHSMDALGLGLNLQVNSRGEVVSEFDCREKYQSYPGILHGGIVSLILDGAMTNCLFAQQIRAVTGELLVRYRRPVQVNRRALVIARKVKSAAPIHYLEAEIWQDEKLCAEARCKFMEYPAEEIE